MDPKTMKKELGNDEHELIGEKHPEIIYLIPRSSLLSKSNVPQG